MLILLSGGYKKDNPKAYDLMSQSKKIVYIPSWHGSTALKDYKKFKKQHPDSKVEYFPINKKPSDKKLALLKNADLIYVDGGNTFYLLNQLLKYNLFGLLKKLSKSKVMAGLSAGAILQTPNINLAKIPDFNSDDNFVKLTKFEALNSVPFEVYPHYDNTKKEDRQLVKYSQTHNRKMYLLPDGSSIVVKMVKRKFLENTGY